MVGLRIGRKLNFYGEMTFVGTANRLWIFLDVATLVRLAPNDSL